MKRALVPQELSRPSAAFNYSPGVLVEGGRLVICSGQVGRDAAGVPIPDPVEQYVAAFENVGRVLAEAGAGFEDVVELVTFHTSFERFELFTAVKDRYVTGPVLPAWTGVGVSELALPGLLVEIKATAVVASITR
jgi:enamine deaminase RidA (YjgF/YER057c/UK114 family)